MRFLLGNAFPFISHHRHHRHHHNHHHTTTTHCSSNSNNNNGSTTAHCLLPLSLTIKLIWILISFLPPGIMSFSANDMVRLRNDILRNYTVGVLPLHNQSVPLPVKMSFFLIMIHDLNMKNQVLTASGWLKFAWCDEFLQWTPEDYGGIDELILFQKEVWLPDIFVENTAQHYREIGNTQMLISVSHQGNIHWEPGIITETSCAVNIGKYPFDTQTCNIRFLTWMHTNKTLTVSPEFDTINLDALLPNGEWDIIKTEAKLYKYPSTYRPGFEHTGVTFVVNLRRKRFFYVLNTIVPVVMLSCLNVLVFILPSDCGERMALAVTVLLAFTVYLGIISDNIPKTSESLSLLAIYLTSLLALSTASVVCAGIVLNIHYRDPSHPVPRFLGWIFSRRKRRRSADDVGRSVSRASCGSFDVLRDQTPCLDRRPTHIWDQRRPSIWAKRQIIREGRRESRDLYYDDHYAIQENSGSEEDEDSLTDTNQRHSTSFISESSTTDEGGRHNKYTDHQNTNTAHDNRSNHVGSDDVAFTNANDVIKGGGGLRKDASIRHLRKKVSYDKISHHEFNSNNSGDRSHNNHKKRKGSNTDDYELETSSTTKKRQDYKYYSKKMRSDTTSSSLNHHPHASQYPRSHSTAADDVPWEIRSLLRRREMEEAKGQSSEVTWHDIGNSLDRWLFWVFFILTNTVTVVILVLFIEEDV